MKKKKLIDKLEEISYEIAEFSDNHTLSESKKDLSNLSDRLDTIIQEIEDADIENSSGDEES